MLPSKEALTKLIGCVYDAAADATLWEPFLGELSRSSRADSAAMVMHHLGREVHTISAGWKVEPDAGRLYQQHFGSIDGGPCADGRNPLDTYVLPNRCA